jgi:ATPase subunit of ABC transporter with duplicated ATPase domains
VRGNTHHHGAVLQVRGLSIETGGTVLLEDVSFTARAREKVGLVGRNGAGKTTLLRTLAGVHAPKAGVAHASGHLGYLSQDPRLDLEHVSTEATGVDHVLAGRGVGDAILRLEQLRHRMEQDHSDANVARYTRAEERFRLDGGYAADGDARRIATGLGLPADRLDLPIRALSGGERRRVEIARILFAGSDVLLLDEPTNHLDNDAKEWLLRFLRAYKGALIVVSHDLELLDEAITRVLHLDRLDESAVGSIVEYTGTYSQYLSARAKDEQRQAKIAARQTAEIQRLSTLADKLRHSTEKMARKAQTLDTRVARLERDKIDAPRGERRIRVRFPEPPHAGRTVLEVEGVAKAYGSLDVLDDVSFDLGRGERLLVMGLNGAGKTTLLRIMAGVTGADSGTVSFGHQVTPGYYAQEHEGIDPGRTLLEHVVEQTPTAPEQQLRSILGTFGITGDKVHQDAGTLSGGEKTKLALAMLVAGRHNLLLLDEPTNNLDPPSREAIAEGLSSWKGSLVIVSHDTGFVERLSPERVLMLPEAQLDFWSDDLLDLVALA